MIAWWRNSRLITKLAVCGASFILPVALLLAFLAAQMQKEITLTRLEAMGMDVVAPLEDLNELLPEHLRQCLDMLASGKPDAALERYNQTARQLLANMAAQANSHRESLALDPASLSLQGRQSLEPDAYARRIQDLITAPPASAEQAVSAHAQAQKLINQMRDYITDSAQLVLDPELPSYYLMSLLITDIPRAQEALGLLYTQGSLDPAHPAAPVADGARMSQGAGYWEETLMERIRVKAAKAGPGIPAEAKIKLNQAVERYVTAVRLFAEALSTPSGGQERYLLSGKEATAAGADLWDLCNDQFKAMLAKRGEALKWRMYSVLGVCLVSILAVALISWAIVVSVTSPLAKMARVAALIAEGRVALAGLQLQDVCPSQNTDCSQHFRSASETLQLYAAMDQMILGLTAMLGEIGASGERIAASAERIAASARQLEATATEQAASATEVGATSKEISATAGQLAGTMSQVLGVARQSSELAEKGRLGLTQMDQVMDELFPGQPRHDRQARKHPGQDLRHRPVPVHHRQGGQPDQPALLERRHRGRKGRGVRTRLRRGGPRNQTPGRTRPQAPPWTSSAPSATPRPRCKPASRPWKASPPRPPRPPAPPRRSTAA